MFFIDEEMTIHVTRGDIIAFSVMAEDEATKEKHTFKSGDIVRFKAFDKKNCENVVLMKDFEVTNDTEVVGIYLEGSETKIGDVISKPKDYWYEVELNPATLPQTIVGYDDDGARILKLYPEGADIEDLPMNDESPYKDVIVKVVVDWLDDNKQDVDLSGYVKKTDIATSTEAGLVKVGGDSAGVKLNASNMLVIASAGTKEIQEMASANRPITPYYLKWAIKTGLTKNDLQWTEEEKALARQLIGAAGQGEIDEIAELIGGNA